MYLYNMLRLVICVLICVFSFAHAQNGFSMQDSLDADLNLVYRKEQYTRFNIHVRGYGIAFGFGRHKTGTLKQIQEGQFNTWSHPKSSTSVSNSNSDRPSYEYGKLFSLYEFTYLYGFRKTLFRKEDRKAIECRHHLLMGPTLFLAKPYYIEIEQALSNQQYRIYSTRFNNDDFNKDSLSVYGRAPFTTGINSSQWHPGCTFKYGLSFDYGNSFQRIRALEIGMQFTQVLPIPGIDRIQLMYQYPAEKRFFNFYLSLILGYKHNRI